MTSENDYQQKGTYSYMPPELFQQHILKRYDENRYSYRDDIWSLCAAFYNCITKSKEPIEASDFYEAAK